MESVSFITGSEIRRLRHYQRRWVLGWCASLVSLLVAAFCVGKVYQDRAAFAEVASLKQELVAVQQDQRRVTESYVTAWENQQATVKAIEEAAEYLRERQSLVDYNRRMGAARVSR